MNKLVQLPKPPSPKPCCDDCVNEVHRIAALLNDRFTDDQIRRLIERLRPPA